MESAFCPISVTGAPTHPQRPAVACVFEIAGRSVLFESPGEPQRGLRELLSGFYFTPARDSAYPPSATIGFRIGDFPSDLGPAFSRFEVSHGAVGYTDGSTCLFDFGNWQVVAQPGQSHRVDVVMRRELDLRRTDELQVLNYAISAALRRCALYELHSGAVIEPRSQRGVLFVGPSGSGKSTLTLQLAENGWQYLTDDVLLLKEVGGVVEAYPLRRAFAVTEATLLASGRHGVRQAFATADWQIASKKRLAPHDLFPGRFSPTCRPGAIFFPTVTDEDHSVVRTLTRSETMIQLIKLCPWACYDPVTSADHLDALGVLAKQTSGFRLLAGRDLLGHPSRVASLVLEHIDSKPE